MILRAALALLLLNLSAATAALAGPVLAVSGWKWRDVIRDLGGIRDAGYAAVLLSPHTATCSGAFGGNGYDPSDFASFDGGFGSEDELRSLIRAAHARGVQVYADMIMNHMCTHEDFRYERFSYGDFHHNGGIERWNDSWSLENQDLFGLNDLAHESSYVRGELWRYLVKTNDMGFDGFRWDAAKHVPRWYWRDHVVGNVQSWGKFSFGEVYDADMGVLQSYADIGMSVTDYSLYDAIRRAFDVGGDLATLDGAGYAQRDAFKAVTFVENHDVGAPPNRILAYAFLAGYPGYPLFAKTGPGDAALGNLAWINSHLATGAYLPRWKERDVLLFEREGHLLVGINQSHAWQTRWIDTSWADARLHDYSGHVGDLRTAGDRRVQVAIPPMGYVMLAP